MDAAVAGAVPHVRDAAGRQVSEPRTERDAADVAARRRRRRCGANVRTALVLASIALCSSSASSPQVHRRSSRHDVIGVAVLPDLAIAIERNCATRDDAASNASLALVAAASSSAMFGFGFALVPFYEQICEVDRLAQHRAAPDDVDEHAGRRDAHACASSSTPTCATLPWTVPAARADRRRASRAS